MRCPTIFRGERPLLSAHRLRRLERQGLVRLRGERLLAHLFGPTRPAAASRPLTSGNCEVLQVARGGDNVHFELVTSEPSPFTRSVSHGDDRRPRRTRLTSGEAGHGARVVSLRRPNLDGVPFLFDANYPPSSSSSRRAGQTRRSAGVGVR